MSGETPARQWKQLYAVAMLELDPANVLHGLTTGSRGSSVHRGEEDCPARRVRPQLHTHRTRHHQDVAIVLASHRVHKKAAPPGGFPIAKFQPPPASHARPSS